MLKTTIVDESLYENPIAIRLSAKQKREYGDYKAENGSFDTFKGVSLELCALIDEQRMERAEHTENVKDWRWQYNATKGKEVGAFGPWPGSANVHTPSTRDAVNTLHAQLMRVCVGIEPYAKMSAGPAPLQEKASIGEDLLNHALADNMAYADKLDMILKDALIEGTRIAKVYWCRTVKTQRDLRRVDSKLIAQINDENTDDVEENPEDSLVYKNQEYRYGDTVEVDIPTLIEDNPNMEYIALDDFAIYPTSQIDLQKAILVGARYRKTANDLLRGVEAGHYDREAVDYLLEKGPSGESTPSSNRLVTDTEEDMGVFPTIPNLQRHQPYEIWEVIYEFDANGDGIDEDCLFTFDYGTKTMLRAIPYPYRHGKRHFVRYCPFPRSDFFFGDSLPQILFSLQNQENAATNQGLDGGSLANAIIALKLNTSDLDLSAHRLKLFEVWPVDDFNELQFPDIPRPGQNAYLDRQVIRSMMEQASGVNDASAGLQPSKSRPLGETSAILEQAGYKFQDIIRRVQSSNNEVFWQVFMLIWQYMDEGREKEITGREESVFDGLTKQQILGNMAIVPHGNNINTNREMELVTAEKLVLAAERNPDMQTPTRKWHTYRRFLNAMGIKDYESFIGTLDEAKQKEANPEKPPLWDQSKVQPDDVTKLAKYIADNPELSQAIQSVLPLASAMGLIKQQADPQAEMQLKQQEGQQNMALKQQQAQSDMQIKEAKAQHQMQIEGAKAQTGLAIQGAQAQQALAVNQQKAGQDSEIKKEAAETQNTIARQKPKTNGR